ncbi:MAG: molybdopterin-dependent oxidoreductase [Dehalococcoidales bacterium]|nr:molybdopterin-dependent oxidoreductase [Dehalococcoidales bacterium]
MAEQEFTQCTVGGPVKVTVKDGKITRMRPIIFDETDEGGWTIEARGKKFSDPRMTTLNPYVVAERMRVYSENRIKYPMKRKNFDPNGDRHTELRGKDEYVRISWDEALDLVAGEIKRIRKTYGPAAITAMASSHHNWGLLFYKMGPYCRFYNILGYTELLDNPDSWEGWHWGAVHAWGYYWKLGHSDNFDILADGLKNCEQVVFWSVDPNTSAGGYCAQDTVIWRHWLRELGIQRVFIDPFCNYTAAHVGEKWLAPRPGTDAAMAEAIAYVWIKEDTYDKWFVENRTVGFEQFKAHILGEEDGIPRTPQWAEKICDVPAHTIVALAREWAAKKTMLACGAMYGTGGACRAAYATEWARLMVLLISMQGLGKPGVNIWGGVAMGAPLDFSFNMPGYASAGWDAFATVADHPAFPNRNTVSQKVYRILLPEAILNPPIHWRGEGFCGNYFDQGFKPMTYPEPGPNGAEIKMIHRHGGSFISTMTDTNRWVKMYQSPKLEFVVMQDCHWQSETKFGDVILPASTNFERQDLSEWTAPGGYGHGNAGTNHRVMIFQHKCIEPLWESKADWEIYKELAKRLGIYDEYTEGRTDEEWMKKIFDYSDLHKHLTYEEFKKKGYFVVPLPKDYKPTVSNRWFYEGRPCDTPDPMNPNLGTDKAHLLATYSGKIEFVSESLTKFDANDEERPPMPRYIPSWEGYDTKDLVKKYPLQMITPHVRFSYHTHHDNKNPWLEDIPIHRIKKNGYSWWPVRLNPGDADARGIQHGDIVKVYNDRGGVLGIAQITERVRPGLLHSYQAGAKYDPLEPGKAGSIDKGGCMNLLTPSRLVSKNAPGMANNSCLVEVCKWEA